MNMKTIFCILTLVFCVNNFGYSQSLSKDTIVYWEECGGEDSVMLQVEISPQFPGGEKARLEYLMEKIDIPFQRQYGVRHSYDVVQGIIFVSFVVERDGCISNVEVLRTIGNGMYDKLAIQAIQEMPKWIPGQHGGKFVRVRYVMPIRFRLWN